MAACLLEGPVGRTLRAEGFHRRPTFLLRFVSTLFFLSTSYSPTNTFSSMPCTNTLEQRPSCPDITFPRPSLLGSVVPGTICCVSILLFEMGVWGAPSSQEVHCGHNRALFGSKLPSTKKWEEGKSIIWQSHTFGHLWAGKATVIQSLGPCWLGSSHCVLSVWDY